MPQNSSHSQSPAPFSHSRPEYKNALYNKPSPGCRFSLCTLQSLPLWNHPPETAAFSTHRRCSPGRRHDSIFPPPKQCLPPSSERGSGFRISIQFCQPSPEFRQKHPTALSRLNTPRRKPADTPQSFPVPPPSVQLPFPPNCRSLQVRDSPEKSPIRQLPVLSVPDTAYNTSLQETPPVFCKEQILLREKVYTARQCLLPLLSSHSPASGVSAVYTFLSPREEMSR